MIRAYTGEPEEKVTYLRMDTNFKGNPMLEFVDTDGNRLAFIGFLNHEGLMLSQLDVEMTQKYDIPVTPDHFLRVVKQ